MRHLSHVLPKVTGQAFARKYIMLGRILTQWADIVGPELASKTQPVGLHRYKSDGKIMTSLDIAATQAEATLLMYRKDVMIQQINLMFGEGWISGIRFIPAVSTTPLKPRKPIKTLTEAEKSYLSEVLETVTDADLKAQLQSLGQAILQDARS